MEHLINEHLINLLFVRYSASDNQCITMLERVLHLEGTFNIHKSALIVIAHPFDILKTVGYLMDTTYNTDVISFHIDSPVRRNMKAIILNLPFTLDN